MPAQVIERRSKVAAHLAGQNWDADRHVLELRDKHSVNAWFKVVLNVGFVGLSFNKLRDLQFERVEMLSSAVEFCFYVYQWMHVGLPRRAAKKLSALQSTTGAARFQKGRKNSVTYVVCAERLADIRGAMRTQSSHP